MEKKNFINYKDFANQIWSGNNFEYIHSHSETFNSVYELSFDKDIDALYDEIELNIFRLIEEELAFFKTMDQSYTNYINNKLKEKGINKKFKDIEELKTALDIQFKFFLENDSTTFKKIKDFKIELSDMKTKYDVDGVNIIAQMTQDPKTKSQVFLEAYQRAKDIKDMTKYKKKVNENIKDDIPKVVKLFTDIYNFIESHSDYFDLTTGGTKVAINAKENLLGTLNEILPGNKSVQSKLNDILNSTTNYLAVDWIKLLASTNTLFDEVSKSVYGNKWQTSKGLGDLTEIAAIEDLKEDLIKNQLDASLALLLSPDIDNKDFKGLGQSGSVTQVSTTDIISSSFVDQNKRILTGISIKMKNTNDIGGPYAYYDFLESLVEVRKFMKIGDPDIITKKIKFLRANTEALKLYSVDDLQGVDILLNKNLEREKRIALFLTGVRAINGLFNPKFSDTSKSLNWEQPKAVKDIDYIITTFLLTKDHIYLMSDLLQGFLKLIKSNSMPFKEEKFKLAPVEASVSDLRELYLKKGEIWKELDSNFYIESMTKIELSSILDKIKKTLQRTRIENVSMKINSSTLEKNK